jgi:hypothetical protein
MLFPPFRLSAEYFVRTVLRENLFIRMTMKVIYRVHMLKGRTLDPMSE